jgi:competence protein ComEC
MLPGAVTLARHPRHVALAALAGGLLLAGRIEVAIACAAGAAAVLVTLVRPAPPALVVALAVLPPAGALVGAARLDAIHRSALAREVGSDVTLRGHVVRRERDSFGTARIRVRPGSVRVHGGSIAARRGWRPTSGLVQVRVRRRPGAVRPSIGDQVVAAGTLAAPGTGGYGTYLRRAGVHVVLHAERVRLTGRRRGGLAGAIDAVRRGAERGVSAGLGDSRAALARGMVLGADEDIPERMAEDFKRSGLAHLLAVSGQNVTLLAVLAWPLLGLLGIARGPRLWTVVALIALYVPLTGAGPSIVRAGAMGIAGTLAAVAGRPASRWYGLLIACVVTLALDPRAWQDVGWQLSFAAVVGIFALARPLVRALEPVPEPLRSGAALTVAATLATAPLMAFHFERASLAVLPANLAALPAVAPVMWLGMLSATAAQVAVEPAELLNAVNGFCLAHVAAVARWGAELPGSALEVRIASPRALALTYAAGAAAVWAGWRLARTAASCAQRRVRRWGLAMLGAAAIAVTSPALIGGAPQPPRNFTVTFLDVGQGEATLLQSPGGGAVLVDGGPPGMGLAGKLRDRGVRTLDLVVLTHASEDHQGGLPEVLESFPVRMLLDGGLPTDGADHRRLVSLAQARGVRVRAARTGQRFRVGRRLRLTVMAAAGPDAVTDTDPNLRATVMTASYRGLDVFLPADAESEVTGVLALPDVDVLKVAHHGSEDPGLPGMLARLRPEVAVIEVGARNRFGHPHPSTLEALRAAGVTVRRTDEDGDVVITEGPALTVDP